MITMVTELPNTPWFDTPLAKIHCSYSAYGNYGNLALFWQQTNNYGDVTAVLSLTDFDMCISESTADLCELAEFVSVIAPKSIFTTLKTAVGLNLNILTNCTALEYKGKCSAPPCENTYEGVEALYNKLRFGFTLPEYEVFMADISHRIRHNACSYVTTKYGAAAILTAKNCAVLTGIAVEQSMRKNGIGSALLSRALSGIREKRILAVAEKDVLNFYIKNGFEVLEECALAEGINE